MIDLWIGAPVAICRLWFEAVFGSPFEQELEMTIGPIRWCYRSRFDGGK